MTSVSTETGADTVEPPYLPGILLDGIAESLLRSTGVDGRSLMVLALVGEICDASGWLVGAESPAETASLDLVLAAARAHRTRMAGAVGGLALAPEPASSAA